METATSPGTHAPFDVHSVLREDGTVTREGSGLTIEEAVAVYRHMRRVRIVDEKMIALQSDGQVAFHSSSLGEEAATCGAPFALRANDWLFGSPRDFGGALVRGVSIADYVAHMFGQGATKGHSAPDHLASRAHRVGSVSGASGAHIPHAVGLAWAAKSKKEDVAVLCAFGEGATSAGDFHAGSNFAGVFKAPVVLFCRNNGVAVSLPAEKQTRTESFAEKGIAYGIPYVVCDGLDVFAVVSAVREAVARASRGEGATLIEARTKRLREGGDPLPRLRAYLEGNGAWSDGAEIDCIAETEEELARAVEQAANAPSLSKKTMFDDVYAVPTRHLAEQADAAVSAANEAIR